MTSARVAERLHLVDGTFELYRAHYSKRPGHTSPAGEDRKATVGLMGSMLALLDDPRERVTHLAIAFDNPIRSFRNDLFAGYKSDEGVPPELRAQFDVVERAARALGITVWSMDRWEADDAIATAVHRFSLDFEQIRVLSPDKDLGQCLRGAAVVQVDRIRDKLIDEAVVREVRGIAPESIPDLLALVGDDADGIPGLAGIGQKGAAALLARWQHIEAIPADPGAWDVSVRGAATIAKTLASERDNALLYKRLATLVTDVPLTERAEDLAFVGVPRASFEAMCDELGATTLRSRPTRWR